MYKYLPYLFLFFVPSAVAFAQAISNVADVEHWILFILEKVNYLLWLIALLAFIWGVVKFIWNANDPKEREVGKSLMVGGVIAFVVLASIWGIVALILQDTFGIFSGAVPYVDSSGTAH